MALRLGECSPYVGDGRVTCMNVLGFVILSSVSDVGQLLAQKTRFSWWPVLFEWTCTGIGSTPGFEAL